MTLAERDYKQARYQSKEAAKCLNLSNFVKDLSTCLGFKTQYI